MVDSLPPPRTSAIYLSLICLAIAILLWPPVLGQVVSLDWKICDMRPVAFGGQLLMAAMAVLVFVGRRPASVWLSKHAPSGKTLIFAFVALSLSTVLCLAVMEVGLRLFRDPLRITWEAADHKRVRYDPILGWTYVGNQSVMQAFVKGQSPVPVHTDERGIRVPTPETKLDPNLPTVIFIGGSFTMGYGLPFEHTFAGQLADYPNFPYQVVNLGVEAYGTDQAWLRLKRYMDTFNTVAVVYTFLPAHVNRNHNDGRRVLFPGVRMVGTKPLFGLRWNGSVYLKKGPVRLEDHSSLRLGVYAQRAWLRWGPEPGLKVSRGLIDAMGKEVEATGAAFILVYWDFWSDEETHFYSVLDGLSFPLVDLCARHPEGWQDMRLPGDSHPNSEAGAYVAKRLAAQFAELGLMSVE
ncbi:MAG: hypothetical protein ACYSWW_26740 [Planctomycetota bacterium]